jgi:hypothetical protein
MFWFFKNHRQNKAYDEYLFASLPDSIPSLCRRGRNHYARTQRVRCNLNSYVFECRRCLTKNCNFLLRYTFEEGILSKYFRVDGKCRSYRSYPNLQSWAKLLRSLTVNSLSYFVKTNY